MSQIADEKFLRVTVYGGLRVNINHLIKATVSDIKDTSLIRFNELE